MPKELNPPFTASIAGIDSVEASGREAGHEAGDGCMSGTTWASHRQDFHTTTDIAGKARRLDVPSKIGLQR